MIDVADVTYRHDDGTTALDGCSLAVADGETVLLCGPNGSGKTTLLQHLNGLLVPDEGTVTVDGRETGEHPVHARTAVGTVFQDPRDGIVAATVGADAAFGPENLGVERAEIDRRVEAALDAVGLRERADTRIEALSGGQRARVAVAGALAMEPAHLALDEPFAGLDWPAARRLLAHLDDLRESGVSLVVATHDLRDLAPRADRVVVLEEGQVVHETTAPAPEELREFGVRPW
ncbi:MAG: energy-coupling factor ABC transporter ATP-binding protein [Haloferacaceae archaeon]